MGCKDEEKQGLCPSKEIHFYPCYNCCIVSVTRLEEIPGDQQDSRPRENWEQLINSLLSSGIPALLVEASSSCETQDPPVSSTNAQNMASSMYKLELFKTL